jgi:hypothetical protein
MRGGYPAIAVIIALAAPEAAYTASQFVQANNSVSTPRKSTQLEQPATPPSKNQPEEKAPPPSVTVIDAADARGVLGREVRATADENMGRSVDVMVDRGGQVRASIIDFGGFLGVGSRKIAVDWKALHFGRVNNKGDTITLELSRDQVRAAPEYKDGKPIIVLGASGNLEPLDFDAPTTPEK